MRGPKTPIKIVLTDKQKKELEKILQDKKTPLKFAKRVKSILMLEEGRPILHIKKAISLQRRIIRKWAYRYLEHGVDGLYDSPRPGRPRIFPEDVEKKLIEIATASPSKYDRKLKRWTCKELCNQLVNDGIVENISLETVRRILKKSDINLKS